MDVALALAQRTTGGNHVEEGAEEGAEEEVRRETATKGMAKGEGGVMGEEGGMATEEVMELTLEGRHTILPTALGLKNLVKSKRPT